MSDSNNLRAELYYHLGNASDASEAVDAFDLMDANRSDFTRLERTQSEMAAVLVDFISQHASALKAQLKPTDPK